MTAAVGATFLVPFAVEIRAAQFHADTGLVRGDIRTAVTLDWRHTDRATAVRTADVTTGTGGGVITLMDTQPAVSKVRADTSSWESGYP